MILTSNTFKRRLLNREVQYGLWLGLANPVAAEICAGADFDWLVIDAEHGPNTITTVLSQPQAVAAYPIPVLVRPVSGDANVIKQLLDIGAQTLLVPMVETVAQAERLVAAIRYPPDGIRGVGTALARAARWNRIENYLRQAQQDICLIVQVETLLGLKNLTAIAGVDGVDGVFIGPADLAGALGHLGEPGHPDVRAAIESAITTIASADKAAGLLAADPELARAYLNRGAVFIGVGVDTVLLAEATERLAARFKSDCPNDPDEADAGY